eukprot:UN10801
MRVASSIICYLQNSLRKVKDQAPRQIFSTRQA